MLAAFGSMIRFKPATLTTAYVGAGAPPAHLAGSLSRAVFELLLSGPSLGLIEEGCQLAHLLAPSAVVIEDVDQAVEFPLPDRSVRARLFELYARGLRLEADIDLFLDRTEGASGAFIAELLRRALVFACEQGSAEVRAEHLETALREIVLSGGGLTRSLLGFEQPPSPH